MRISLVEFIVFTENETYKTAVLINDRELVDLVVPDDVVCFFESRSLRCGNELLDRSHELLNLCIRSHTAYTIVSCCYETQELTC